MSLPDLIAFQRIGKGAACDKLREFENSMRQKWNITKTKWKDSISALGTSFDDGYQSLLRLV